jgi:MoxR-like ATPase
MRLAVGYPSREDELQVLATHRGGEPVDTLRPALSCEQIVSLQQSVREVTVEDSIHEYLLDLIEATRNSDDLHVGASTRGALCLYRASQALALVEGRDFVVPDDVKRLAVPVLSHRLITKGYVHGGNQRRTAEGVVERLLDEVAAPK